MDRICANPACDVSLYSYHPIIFRDNSPRPEHTNPNNPINHFWIFCYRCNEHSAVRIQGDGRSSIQNLTGVISSVNRRFFNLANFPQGLKFLDYTPTRTPVNLHPELTLKFPFPTGHMPRWSSEIDQRSRPAGLIGITDVEPTQVPAIAPALPASYQPVQREPVQRVSQIALEIVVSLPTEAQIRGGYPYDRIMPQDGKCHICANPECEISLYSSHPVIIHTRMLMGTDNFWLPCYRCLKHSAVRIEINRGVLMRSLDGVIPSLTPEYFNPSNYAPGLMFFSFARGSATVRHENVPFAFILRFPFHPDHRPRWTAGLPDTPPPGVISYYDESLPAASRVSVQAPQVAVEPSFIGAHGVPAPVLPPAPHRAASAAGSMRRPVGPQRPPVAVRPVQGEIDPCSICLEAIDDANKIEAPCPSYFS